MGPISIFALTYSSWHLISLLEVVVLTLWLLASRLDTFLSLLFLLTTFASSSRALSFPPHLWSHQNSSPSHRLSFFSLSIHLRLSLTLSLSLCLSILAKITRILLAHSRLGHQQIASWTSPSPLRPPNIEIFFYPYTWPLDRPLSILF